MIKKTLATLTMLTAFALSHTAIAGGLEDDMKTLGKNYKAFNQADNAQTATAALNNMRAAAEHSRQYKLAPNTTEKVSTSTSLFDQIIGEIDKTKLLVQAGKLDEAKKQGKKIAELRDQGHKYYTH
ncbi:cytochrome b562 [Acinetobacter sp. A47]|uniref:cytochrome b562 n=1 Tax=Acinetobacter sp. A47 TaxID=1561217 RepID=UPI000570B2E7|nr:cytochrome b562 [Acinetobacter sp. A47]